MLPDKYPWNVVLLKIIAGSCKNNILNRKRSNGKNIQKSNVEKLNVYRIL
jgi:hypothetical protein